MSHLYTPIELTGEPVFDKFGYIFKLKKGAWNKLKDFKEWKTDSQGAEGLGFSRGYISLIIAGKEEVSHEFIIRVAVVCGNIDGNWWSLFEIVKDVKKANRNHQKFNMAKHMKRMPYTQHSVAAIARSKESPTEVLTMDGKIKILDNAPA